MGLQFSLLRQKNYEREKKRKIPRIFIRTPKKGKEVKSCKKT